MLPAGALVVVAAAGCSGEPGGLVADRRVRGLEPAPGSTTTNPIELRWTTTIEPDDGLFFAVFLDASMVPPGESVLPYAGGACDSIPACIEAEALLGPNVFVTDGTSADAGTLAAGPHRFFVTIVDDVGVRQGDVAWNASFTVEDR